MSKYNSSEITQNALIEATGKLAAQMGFDNVSTRDIAKNAKENIGSIHYHFQNKEGLFKATILKVIERMHATSLSEILKPFKGSLESKTQQAKAIILIINNEVNKLFNDDIPIWHSQVIFQLMQNDGCLQNLILEKLMYPKMKAFNSLLKKINPEISEKESVIDYLIMLSPIYFHANNQRSILNYMKEKKFSPNYLETFKHNITKRTLLYYNLPTESLDTKEHAL